MSAVIFMGFTKETASVPIVGYANDKTLEENIKIEVAKVIAKLKDIGVAKDQRQIMPSQYGKWFCKKDDKGVLYFALCVQKYPERHIYAAIQQLRTHLATIGDYSTQPDSTLKLHAKVKLVQICQKYNNPKNLDKIGRASVMLDDLKVDLTQNTNKLMSNQSNLDGLHQKTISLGQNAQIFQKQAHTIKRQMWCKNCKMTIIIILVVIALICVIVIPIATR